jgi:hypothetical protein
MALPGLVAANNLSDAADREAVWGNLGAGIDATIPTTNLLLRSEEFGQIPPWTLFSGTVISNAIEAPNGSLTADKIAEVSGVSGPVIDQSRTGTNETMVLSVFCKQAERFIVRLGFYDVFFEASAADFDLTNGDSSVLGVGVDYANPSASTVAFNDGWYRCIFKVTKNNVNSINNPYLAVLSGPLPVTSGNGIYFWGAQLEQAEEAGPYVRTTTAPVTASPTASIVVEGDDILELVGARIASVADFVRIKGLATPAQPRLTTAAANAGSGIALRDDALVKASPSSEGDFFITRGTLDGQSLRVNGLSIASISGSPFSGSTASCPLSISSFAAPTNLRLNNAMTSGTLAFPEKAIPIETNDFILYAKAGQS